MLRLSRFIIAALNEIKEHGLPLGFAAWRSQETPANEG